jgi:hypothetical protein
MEENLDGEYVRVADLAPYLNILRKRLEKAERTLSWWQTYYKKDAMNFAPDIDPIEDMED